MKYNSRRYFGLAVAAGTLLACTFAASAQDCRESRAGMPDPAITLRIDNDLFGRKDQDQGYTNGLQLTAMSPNLADYRNDPCLPRIARWVNRYLAWLHPGGFDQQNMVVSLGQELFTPSDDLATELIEDDRPYAAALMLSFGYNARQGDRLRTTHVRIGIVGPSAYGQQVQDAWHDLIGVRHFEGWDNQLRDEPVIQLVKERMRRYATKTESRRARWSQDLILHYGGAVGNLASYGNAGAEWRFGWKLPDDFGSTPLRPAGENTAPQRARPDPGWSGHFFTTFDARLVLNDITLDGNTWKDSHSVDRRPLVMDVGYGVAVTRGRWKVAFARYLRTFEFEGQAERPVFGSFTVSRKF